MNLKYIIFSVGSEYYAVNILNITCIEDFVRPVPVHGAPAYIKGVMELRGDIVPVISMRYVFGCEAGDDAGGKMLITDIGDVRLALLVDDVEEIYSPSDSPFCELPPLVKCPATEYADGVVKKENNIMICIAPDKILSKAQLGDIDKIRRDMQ